MELFSVLKKRKSVRSYLPKRVESEKINTIVQAANLAPTSARLSFMVITNPDILRLISEEGRSRLANSGVPILQEKAAKSDFSSVYNAPVLITLFVPKPENQKIAELNLMSAGCAVQTMLLAATNLGLASCCVSTPLFEIKSDMLLNHTGIGKENEVLCGVALGYSTDTAPHGARALAKNVHFCE